MSLEESKNKILVVQDRLTTPGGGERLVHHISNNFDCDIVTGEYEPESTYDFDDAEIITLGGNSFAEFIKCQSSINWEDYDAAIFSGNRPQFCLWRSINIPTIRYCHSPARMFWSLRDSSYRDSSPAMKCVRHLLAPTYRQIDKRLAAKHDKILTNSHNIRSQVDRFYGLDSDVLHPPIEFDKYSYEESGDFWLSVNRLVPKKRVQEQIDAFKGTDEELKVVGGIDEKFSTYGNKIKETVAQSDNVEIEGFISDEGLRDRYARCKGVIYIPYFEDFGIVPIEAMASGKPVLAAAEGGPIETVTHGDTGWLVKPSSENIQGIITSSFDAKRMQTRSFDAARKYDVKNFTEKLNQHIASLT